MGSPVEQIKERLSIADVVGAYLKLEKAGSSLKAKCPFHNEKTPSFFVSPARGTYYCFGCGAHGDVFSFVQAFEGLDFPGALRVLASRAGVPLKREDPKVRSERERLYAVLDAAASFFAHSLERAPAAGAYLKKRGVESETAARWRLGYAPNEWHALSDALSGQGFGERELARAGLVKAGERGAYDTFRGRVVFPIFDSSGRVIAFSGRILEEEKNAPKYLNSPETEVFSKSRILHGLDKAKMDIRKRDYAILVEGQMDLILSHQAGFTNTVAASGTALSGALAAAGGATNLGLLTRLSKNLILAFDSDEAGREASFRSAKIALGLGMEVKVAAMPEGADPADVVSRSKEEWKRIIRDSKPVVDFYLDEALGKRLPPRLLGKEVEKRLLPLLALVPSAIDAAVYLARISKATGIPEGALSQELSKRSASGDVSAESAAPAAGNIPAAAPRQEAILRKLMGIIWWKAEGKDERGIGAGAERKLRGLLGGGRYEAAAARLEALRQELVYEAELSYEEAARFGEETDDLLLNFEEELLRERLAEAMRGLAQAEEKKESARVGDLLKECQALSGRLAAIRNARGRG